jgi:hypothetical protein
MEGSGCCHPERERKKREAGQGQSNWGKREWEREESKGPVSEKKKRYGPDTWVTFQTGDMGNTASDLGQFGAERRQGKGEPGTWVTFLTEDIGDGPETWVTGRSDDIGDRCSNRGSWRAANALDGDLPNG